MQVAKQAKVQLSSKVKQETKTSGFAFGEVVSSCNADGNDKSIDTIETVVLPPPPLPHHIHRRPLEWCQFLLYTMKF